MKTLRIGAEADIKWIKNGKIWNELDLLRAFLQNKSKYSIVFFQNMMEQKHIKIFIEKWPFDSESHGGSIWLKKEKRFFTDLEYFNFNRWKVFKKQRIKKYIHINQRLDPVRLK